MYRKSSRNLVEKVNCTRIRVIIIYIHTFPHIHTHTLVFLMQSCVLHHCRFPHYVSTVHTGSQFSVQVLCEKYHVCSLRTNEMIIKKHTHTHTLPSLCCMLVPPLHLLFHFSSNVNPQTQENTDTESWVFFFVLNDNKNERKQWEGKKKKKNQP